MSLNKNLLYSGPVNFIYIGVGGGTYIYYTLDGVQIRFETQFADQHMDQIPGIATKKKMGHKVTISFKVPELTADLAVFALAQPDSNLTGGTLVIDNDQRAADVVTIEIPSVSGRAYQYWFHKCYCLGASEIRFANGQQAAWQIDFEAFWHPSLNKWGTITEGF